MILNGRREYSPFGRREDVRVGGMCCRESVEDSRVPTSRVQREIYPTNVKGNSVPETKKLFALAVIEWVQEFGGGLVRGIGRSTLWESGLRCWSGRRFSEGRDVGRDVMESHGLQEDAEKR